MMDFPEIHIGPDLIRSGPMFNAYYLIKSSDQSFWSNFLINLLVKLYRGE